MDYQFEHETGTGRPLARVALEQESFGTYLTEEVGQDEVRIVQLLRLLHAAPMGQLPETSVDGHEWTLSIEGDAVTLEPHGGEDFMDAQTRQLLEDDAIDSIDGCAPAVCGIDDFRQLLQAWHAFIRT